VSFDTEDARGSVTLAGAAGAANVKIPKKSIDDSGGGSVKGGKWIAKWLS
jgi:hypothetical protein